MNRFIELQKDLTQKAGVGNGQNLALSAAEVPPDSEDLGDRDWYRPEDLIVASLQASRRMSRQAATANDASWAEDAVSPDYRHIGEPGMSVPFMLTDTVLAELARINHFNVEGGQDEVLFGLRGCRLIRGTSSAFANSVQLSEDMPDHSSFHCVIGVWKRSTQQITVFQGSTVPNWWHMEQQRSKGGQRANMLLTGRYVYTVGKHRAVEGAFIQQPNVIVLRSNDDLIYETTDQFERHSPADNIHPSFAPKEADFSSAGCQTVKGSFSKKNGHTGLWGQFRAAAGLAADNKSRWGDKYVFVLLTGRDARLVAANSDSNFMRLRFGSSGDSVSALQQGLKSTGDYTGPIDGDMGKNTTWAFIRWQQKNDSGKADGIVMPALGLKLGFDMVNKQSVAGPDSAASLSVALRARARSFGAPADGSPFVKTAVEQVAARVKQFRKDAAKSDSANFISANKISSETGIKVDANPYVGITEMEIEAVVRAGFTSRQMPEVLLAIWSKEGSTNSVTSWRSISGATSEANAKTIFRNDVYYQDLGVDLFMDTTRPGGKGDNKVSNTDAEAVHHEKTFKSQVASFVSKGFLDQDVSGAINAELQIKKSGPTAFEIKPTVKFYALSLLLADAYFTQLEGNTFAELSSLSLPLNYLQWNIGTGKFKQFLASAENHRNEAEFVKGGEAATIDHWALHTVPKLNEWYDARKNALRFLHYLESYQPLFALALNLIKPGIEDLPPPPSNAG